jgi:hemerythrin
MLARPLRPLIGRQHALGHEVIDLDHKAIADWWFRVAGCEQIQFPFFLARLKKLLSSHFDHEAALMQQAGGALCPCHRREHQMLLDLCDQAAAESGKNWRRTQALIRSRFPKLVRDHIVSMDQSVVLFIKTNGPIAQA